MGLDMYFLAKTANSNEYVEAGYWRKANAIHKWFVENVQNGIDECQLSVVSRDQINMLLERVELVLRDNSRARELLPTTSGFFFGSTDHDEWYFRDLEDTQEILKKALDILDGDDTITFYYQSSW